MERSRRLKRADNWILVIKRLRTTTGGSFAQVKDFMRRHNYTFCRSDFVKFCNNSFVIRWTHRGKDTNGKRKEMKK